MTMKDGQNGPCRSGQVTAESNLAESHRIDFCLWLKVMEDLNGFSIWPQVMTLSSRYQRPLWFHLFKLSFPGGSDDTSCFIPRYGSFRIVNMGRRRYPKNQIWNSLIIKCDAWFPRCPIFWYLRRPIFTGMILIMNVWHDRHRMESYPFEAV
jgi:hypothetical protein